MSLMTINPETGECLKTFDEQDAKTVESCIERSQECFLHWRAFSLNQRTEAIGKLRELLKANEQRYANLISLEMGKLYTESLAEVRKCALLCDYYFENAQQLLAQVSVKTEYAKSYVSYQPLGVILGIMPWNFPFWQVFRFAVPALLVGNSILLKHASNVPQCGQQLASLFNEAGVDGFHHLLISSPQVAQVIAHPKVKALSLTGSSQAGREVAQLAGRYLKKAVLELGGSDPYIILKDADLESAVEKCVQARFLNMGQSCISAKRFIIEAPIYDEFVELFKQKLKGYEPGSVFDSNTMVAPLATAKIRENLHEQVLQSLQKGAQCILGGKPYERPGFYYQPTLLTEVKAGMPAYDEELFGPVASMIKAQDENAAIQIANDTIYGLGSAIFSRSLEKAEQLAKQEIQAGSCFINDFVKSDPRLPFGGINESGYGRELSGYGLLEFTNIKTVCLEKAPS